MERHWRAAGEASAKLNLGLWVLGLESDGFHSLRSVMIDIDLCDHLELEARWNDSSNAPETTRVQLQVEGGDAQVPRDQNNLVVKAAHLLLARRIVQLAATAAQQSQTDFASSQFQASRLSGVAYTPPHELAISLRKNIPTEAGLGGGSADAAATLRLLNGLPGMGVEPKTLLDLATALGSDVPFALTGGAALAEGRGERLTPLEAPHSIPLVLVQPHDVRIPTPWCYRRWDELHAALSARGGNGRDRSEHLEGIKRALQEGDVEGLAAHLFNDLEEPVLAEYPRLKEIKDTLRKAGCAGALMTGSGSCFFGVARDEATAAAAAAAVESAGLGRTWLSRTRQPSVARTKLE
jgi:4-diphosphocytidyl-2-C-methyl-D-erythritol kinase